MPVDFRLIDFICVLQNKKKIKGKKGQEGQKGKKKIFQRQYIMKPGSGFIWL